ncbi:MAG: hypothetical protein HC916_18070 [Coleofasciculaceae cyanobacterium SM2_1_6]|nr:hypothetical protein [Coleofasciculaceae cyanobacterium SM2_1_6]
MEIDRPENLAADNPAPPHLQGTVGNAPTPTIFYSEPIESTSDHTSAPFDSAQGKPLSDYTSAPFDSAQGKPLSDHLENSSLEQES